MSENVRCDSGARAVIGSMLRESELLHVTEEPSQVYGQAEEARIRQSGGVFVPVAPGSWHQKGRAVLIEDIGRLLLMRPVPLPEGWLHITHVEGSRYQLEVLR